jgi:hypothetical protein
MRNTSRLRTTNEADKEYEEANDDDSEDFLNSTMLVQVPAGVSTEKRMLHA